MERLLWICAGGAVGSGARYLVSLWMLERCGSWLPWGTLTVNLAGSFLLGFVMQASVAHARLPPLALTAGVLGGFTTYSSFNQETLACLERGEPGRAGLNVLATLLGCLAAGFAGQSAARWTVG